MLTAILRLPFIFIFNAFHLGDSPPNWPFLWGDPGPHPIHAFRAHPSPQPKQHLDRFSRFCRAHGRVQQTDRLTDHATSVAIGRIFVLHIRCGLMITRCCSTDSEGPHRCCHLPNDFDSRITLSPLSTSNICLAFVFFAFCSSHVLVFY